MPKWVVHVCPDTFEADALLLKDKQSPIVTASGYYIATVEANNAEEAKYKATGQILLGGFVEDLRGDRARLLERIKDIQSQKQMAVDEYRIPAEKLRQFIIQGRLEIAYDGKYLYIDWHSPDGKKSTRSECVPSTEDLIDCIVEAVEDAAGKDYESWD